MEIKSRFFQEPQQSFFLFGPRGTGKSTWLKHHHPQAFLIDLLNPEMFRSYSARPERLREVVEAQEPGRTIIVDEIQKVPQLLDVVHLLLEGNKPPRFILTGSSARKLKRSGVDLLAGRALVKTLHPFMASELGKGFSLKNALTFGTIPLVADSPSPEETIRSYVAVYLKEEVQAEGLVRSIGGFSRFLESISFSHGSVLNIADVARDCQVERKTAEVYISILEDLLLAFRLPVFSKRAKRNLSAHPKFYYFDPGVFRSLRPAGPLDSPQEIEGAALEGLVAEHLRAWNAYSGERDSVYFWRTKAGNEVDFVVYGNNVFSALEVKNATRLKPKMLQGLLAFKEDYPEAQVLFLYRGRERLKMKKILCLPVQEFLMSLEPHKPLWG
ncbi:MAG: ATP-binding protein [Deltaproteobacteria bacterium]|nr:ATP-binding protein [Deltaproteobacteria bacterium]